MFQRIKRLYLLLTKEQRRKLLGLQALVILMAFAELAGVLTIGPFMAIVGDIGRLAGDGLLAQLYQAAGMESPREFLFWMGIAVLVSLAIAAAISMYATWRLALNAQQIGAELATRLYRHYMHQPWLFHVAESSSQLTNRIAQESVRITNSIIQPLLQMNAKAVMALVMATAIFLFNPFVAVAGLAIFGVSYAILFRTVRRRLEKNGGEISKANQLRLKLLNEGLGGIKDTLLLGRQEDFNCRFESASLGLGHARGVTQGLSEAPRYVMDMVAFGAVIFLMLYLLSSYDGDLGQILPILSVYALAGFKLLPAFQQIYRSLAVIKGNMGAFDILENDLKASQMDDQSGVVRSTLKLHPQRAIALENIHFRYPRKTEKALDGLTFTIPVNQVVGLVGPSGSGKSTAIDVLLGLIEPEQGSLIVDGKPVTKKNLRAWQNNIGLVSQSIFLADATIRENIAFGIPLTQINEERVKRAARMAHLDELLRCLPDGLETRVGERGVQLSGGQCQRIGIARALYDDADVLVLDEATSALDGITEKLVMDAIHDFAGKKTIIMIAHRLATVKKCNCIFVLERGRVIDKGSYEQLAKNNLVFKQMSELS